MHDKTRGFTEKEWALLRKADWLELAPPQMKQYLATLLAAKP